MTHDIRKTTVHDLLDLYRADIKLHHRKAIKTAEGRADRIEAAFGRRRATELTTRDFTAYRKQRRETPIKNRLPGGATVNRATAIKNRFPSDATVNREFQVLKRAFNLGYRHDPPLVTRVPHIPMAAEPPPRIGFFEHDAFEALRGAFPGGAKGDHLKVALTIGYYSAMRVSEVLALRWERVEFDRRIIRLEPGTTKNDEGREVPIIPALYDVLDQWRRVTLTRHPQCPWVIHRAGQAVSSIKTGWNSAVKRLGLVNAKGEPLTFHDLRRTAVRNMIRAGIPEVVAMRISGHKTRSVFDWYNIVSKADLEDAATRMAQFAAAQPRTVIQRLYLAPNDLESAGASDTQVVLRPNANRHNAPVAQLDRAAVS